MCFLCICFQEAIGKSVLPKQWDNQEGEWHGNPNSKGINKITRKSSPKIKGAQPSLENIVQTGEGGGWLEVGCQR